MLTIYFSNILTTFHSRNIHRRTISKGKAFIYATRINYIMCLGSCGICNFNGKGNLFGFFSSALSL
ncbi:MAG TPA: hypothetical protein [Caudoviricetes sp.]|nr:MAG TPA: hypothetical protein [Caudoviricetes sp.]